jgi:predicted MFS family arabinose efflux permease
MAMLAFGGGGLAGTAVVPLLVNWRGARFALRVGACGVTAFTALLAATHGTQVGAVATLFAVGFHFMSRLNGFIPPERAAENSFQLQLIESA